MLIFTKYTVSESKKKTPQKYAVYQNVTIVRGKMPLFIETRTDAARPAAARFFCTFGAVLSLLSFLQFSWEEDTSFNRFSDEKFECPVEACDHFDYFLSKCCFTLLGTFVLLCTA